MFLFLFLLFLLSFFSLLSFLAGNIRNALGQHAIDQHTAHGEKKQDAANLGSVHFPYLTTRGIRGRFATMAAQPQTGSPGKSIFLPMAGGPVIFLV